VQTIPPRGTAFWRLLRSPSLAPVFLGGLMRDGSQRLSHHQIASNTVAHGCPFLFESKSGKSRYTRLSARISEEEGLLYDASQAVQRDGSRKTRAWGEEIVVRDGF
jgi:hypothetical protein